MKYLAVGCLTLIAVMALVYTVFLSENSLIDNNSIKNSSMNFLITSPAFKNNETIPAKFTCDGRNINPPLLISDIPDGTVSLALIMDDPDVPKVLKPDGMFDHWVVYSIPVAPGQTAIEIPEDAKMFVSGLNGTGQESYTGPCPPPEYEPTEHRYFFKVYALSTELSFLAPPKKSDVESAMKGFIIDSTELVGLYDRK